MAFATLENAIFTPAETQQDTLQKRGEILPDRQRRIKQGVALTFIQIEETLDHYNLLNNEPEASEIVKVAAQYTTIIRGLRAIQIMRRSFGGREDSPKARAAIPGIIRYLSRPDSPFNTNMEDEVLSLDLSRRI